MVFGTVPGSVFAQEASSLCEVCQSDPCTCEASGDSTDGVGETDESENGEGENTDQPGQNCYCPDPEVNGHYPTCIKYVCPDCGTAGWHETCPETDTPTETTPCEVCGTENCTTEHVACDICGKFETGADPCTCEPEDATDSCPYCDFYFTEDGTLLHGLYCNAAYAYDGTADVGKFLQLIEAIGSCNISDGSDFVSGGMEFYFDEFLPGTVMHITDWYWDSGTTGLWYAVTFTSGGIAENAAEYWPETPWVLYDYTDTTYEYDESLEFIRCPACGNHICKIEHVYCEICSKWDCAIKHAYCGVCGTLDCPTEHVYCHVCRGFDCGLTHEKAPEEDHTPLTAPVIPEDPQLPEEYTVAVVDGSGNTVTEESGLLLAWNEKASLSAWSALGEDVSYQWQIFIGEGDSYWVDITGQTGKGILFSRAMLLSVLDESGSAWLRCVTNNGAETAVSEEICVTVVSPAADTLSLLSMRSTARSGSSSQNGDIALASEGGGTDEDVIIHKVMIEYIYTDDLNTDGTNVSQFSGQRVSIPYIVDALDGNILDSTPVTSPNCIGYAPNAEQASIDLSTLGPITENKTIVVEYYPDTVSYTVRHYLQNVDDDEYVWIDTTMAEGKTESLTSDDSAKDYVGFTALSHYHEKIAADSSTVIDIYYDRNYYMMSFDLAGGFGVDPIYARYQAPISIGTPYMAGYTFAGWKDENDNIVTIPKYMPDVPGGEITYTASWNAVVGNAKYTVVYWLEDANTANKYNFWGSVLVENATAGKPVPSGFYTNYEDHLDQATIDTMDPYEKQYSYYSHEDTNVTIKGDNSTVFNVYYKRNEYTLKFYYAISSGSGDDETYYVVGGSTYYFGTFADGINSFNSEDNEIDLFGLYTQGNTLTHSGNGVNPKSQTGEVESAPTLKDDAKGKYTSDSDTHGNYKLHYISFSAKYGADISDLWPCDVFNSVTRSSGNTGSGAWGGDEAFVSAWNGEHHVYYTQRKSGNQTIKGNYSELDYQVLWDYTKFGDSDTVAYLCFWENGANIGWSVPELYRYNVCVPYIEAEKDLYVKGENGDYITKIHNGNQYYVLQRYDTIDDSSAGSQTAPAINGLTYLGDTNGRTSEALHAYTGDDPTKNILANKDDSPILFDGNEQIYREAYDVFFYYSRTKYDLIFINGDTKLKEEPVDFNDSILDKEPTGLEYHDPELKDIYQFSGWYTSPDTVKVPESKFELTGATMPANPLTLYAGWNKITHKVTIHLTEGGVQVGEDLTGSHDEPLPNDDHPDSSKLTHPTDSSATFIGWFYRDENGVEYAFDFNTMTITRPLEIYAKWRSDVMKQVEISYILLDENGNPTLVQVATTETLTMRLGQTRTFDAKTGTSLYATFQTGYFPTTASHSITIQDSDINTNDPVTFEFKYRHYGTVPYQVKFTVVVLNEDGTVKTEHPAFRTVTVDGVPTVEFVAAGGWTATDEEFIEQHWDNNKAVVVELFEPDVLANEGWDLPDEYLPDALRVSKVIVPDKDNPTTDISANTIEFIYTYTEPLDPDDPDYPDPDPDDPDPDPDDPNPIYKARYLVQHFVQSTSNLSEFVLYPVYSEILGLSGEKVEASPISIAGYFYDYSVTNTNKQAGTTLTGDVMSGTIKADDSLELNFYYTLKSYPYKVLYLEEGTNRVLHEAKTTDSDGNQLTGLFGSTVWETAIPIDEYLIVGADKKSIEIKMEAGNTANVNTIVFFYKLKSADLIISKQVALDEEQAKEEGISKIPDAALNQAFTFTIVSQKGFNKLTYECTITTVSADDTVTETTGTILTENATTMVVTLKHGQTIAIHNLIMGTYTITETYVPGFRITVDGNTDAQQKESVSITAELIEADKDVTVNFLNSYPFFVGDLEISKTVAKLDGTDPDPVGDDRYYKVAVVLNPDDATREVDRVITFVDKNGDAATDAGGNTSFTVPALTGSGSDQTTFTINVLVPVDGKVILKGVPAGTFTATETVKGNVGYIADFYTVTYDKVTHKNEEAYGTSHVVTGAIHGGHSTEVTFNNTYKKGDLTINKTVALEYAKDKWTSDTFTFTVTGTTELPDGTYHITVGGVPSTVTVTGGKLELTRAIAITRTAGQTSWSGSLTLENLPAGYYTVTETAGLGNDKYNATGPSGSLLVNNTVTPTEANFVNQYKTQGGNFTITKTSATPGQVFVYRVVGENGLNIEVTVVVGADRSGSTTIVDLPFGVYTVTQQNNWSWRYIRDVPEQVKEHDGTAENSNVHYGGGEGNSKWLSGISNFIKRIFGGT